MERRCNPLLEEEEEEEEEEEKEEEEDADLEAPAADTARVMGGTGCLCCLFKFPNSFQTFSSLGPLFARHLPRLDGTKTAKSPIRSTSRMRTTSLFHY